MTQAPPLLLHAFSTFAVGGPQVRFAAIANHFGRRWRHAVVAMDGDLSARRLLDRGLDVTYPALALPKGDTLGNVRRCRAFLRAMRPEVLVTSNWGSIEWALANAPAALPSLVRHVHGEDGFSPQEQAGQLPRRVWLRRLALRRATVVVPSTGLRDIALRRWWLRPGRVHLVPNGIDLGRFAPRGRETGSRETGSRETGGIVIGTVAALRAEKNLGRLLRAVAGLPAVVGARLVVVGDGPERAGLAEQARALGLAERVLFAGHSADPSGFYAGFDLFALSSDTEQMPLSVLEAMAAGLPVVATDVGDVARTLAPENRAWVVPAEDSAFARALAGLAGDRAAWDGIGKANRARAEREFDQARMFETYAALFDGGPESPRRAGAGVDPRTSSSCYGPTGPSPGMIGPDLV